MVQQLIMRLWKMNEMLPRAHNFVSNLLNCMEDACFGYITRDTTL